MGGLRRALRGPARGARRSSCLTVALCYSGRRRRAESAGGVARPTPVLPTMRLPLRPTSTQVLRAYEVVLPAHGKSVQDDSHYYRQVQPSTAAPLPITALTASSHRTQLLQWSLSASTYYAWRECLVTAFASTPFPASPTASSTSACTPKPPPQPMPSPGPIALGPPPAISPAQDALCEAATEPAGQHRGPLPAVATWPVHPPPPPLPAPPLATSHGSAAPLSDGGGGDFLASRSKRPFGCLSDGRPSPSSPPSPLPPPPPPPPPDRPASPNGHSSGSWRSRGPSSPPERPLGPKGAGREAGREVAWEALGLEASSFTSACDRPFGAGHCPSDLAAVPPRQRPPSPPHHYSPPPPARSRSPLRPSSPHRSTSATAYRVRVGGGYLYGDHPLPPRRIGESCRRQQVDLVRGSRARQGAREGSTRRLVSVPVRSPESRKSEGPRPLNALTLAAPALP